MVQLACSTDMLVGAGAGIGTCPPIPRCANAQKGFGAPRGPEGVTRYGGRVVHWAW